MKDSKIAPRYAKALFDLAVEHKKLEQVKTDMLFVHQVCSENKDFQKMLKSPVIKADKKKAIFHAVFSGFDSLSLGFIDIITKHSRESILDSIAWFYIDYYKKHFGIKTAFVQTAIALDETTRNKLIKLLEQQTKSIIELSEKVNTNLIGGMIVNIDNEQFDLSFSRSLKKMHQEFDVNVFEKGF